MAGNAAGGRKARETNIKRHGANFYKNIASLGGKASNTGGFKSEKVGADGLTGKQRAKIAGSVGGLNSWKKRKGWAE